MLNINVYFANFCQRFKWLDTSPDIRVSNNARMTKSDPAQENTFTFNDKIRLQIGYTVEQIADASQVNIRDCEIRTPV